MVKTIAIIIICLIPAFIMVDFLKGRVVKHEIKRISEKRDDLNKKQLALLKTFADPTYRSDIYVIGNCLYKGAKLNAFFVDERLENRQIPKITTRLLNEKYPLFFNTFPKKIYIFLGANDLLFEFPYTYIIKNTDLLLENLNKDYPNCEINLFSLFPVNRKSEDGFKDRDGGIYKEDVEYSNIELNSLAKKYNINFLDAYTLLSDKYGNLKKEYTKDGIFLNDFAIEEIIIPLMKNSL